jgi:RNA polymerase sigma factor (sigma-70 family)
MKSQHFELELSKLRPTLYGFTRKFTSNRDESLDLVQDTILKALNHRSKFRDDVNLKGWLYTIMRNTFINQYRKSSKFKKSTGEHAQFQYLNVEETHTFNRPEGTMQFKEVWDVVNSIKEELAKPFKMYTSGYKYHEIAEHLHLPLGTVKNRIFQARQEIQKHLTGYC